MGNSNIISLKGTNIIHTDNIREVDKDKVIINVDNTHYPCAALYFHDDVKEVCFKILQEIKEKKRAYIRGLIIYHYNAKIYAIVHLETSYRSKSVISGSGGYNIDVKRLL